MKTTVRKDIKEATQLLKDFMTEMLDGISEEMILSIISRTKKLPESQKINAIKDFGYTGKQEYKRKLLDLISEISIDALEKARKEVPKKKNIRLADAYDKLPPKIQKKLSTQSDLIVETQLADLEKAVMFQFTSSLDSTDSLELLASDLGDAADEYITGPSILGGASATSASAINDTRNYFFMDDEVQDEIEGFHFINGDPVSEICQDLSEQFGPGSGNYIAKDDPDLFRYSPPLHFNCKSTLEPILKGELKKNAQVKSFAPSTSKLGDKIQFAEACCSSGELHFVHIENPRKGNLQTIIVDKTKAKNIEEAKKIAKDYGAEHLQPDETSSSFRFRQRNPSDFVEGSFRTKKIDGVSLVYGELKT